eukprot:snap_masked-scaffold_1-processed-gene-10.11-mRNA-1 protein AED:1.00 eAED:1.00 QI:0/-1/0/0/-1/1/1/0/645
MEEKQTDSSEPQGKTSEPEELLSLDALKPRKPDEELISYVTTIEGSLASDLKDKEKAMLLKNFFNEIEKKEASLSSIKRTSYALDRIFFQLQKHQVIVEITTSVLSQILCQFLKHISPYFGYLAYNRFSSHVFENYLLTVHILITEHEGNFEPLENLLTFLMQEILEQDLWNMLNDNCATHVLRSMLLLFSGELEKTKKRKKLNVQLLYIKGAKQEGKRREAFQKCLEKSLVVFSRFDKKEIEDILYNEAASPVLQILLEKTSATRKNKKKNNSRAWNTLSSKILSLESDEDVLKKNFQNLSRSRIASHTLEILVSFSERNQFELFFNKCLKGNIRELAEGNITNFLVQRSIERMDNNELLEVFFEEVLTSVEESLIRYNFGVIYKYLNQLLLLSSLPTEAPSIILLQEKAIYSLNKGLNTVYSEKYKEGMHAFEILVFETANKKNVSQDKDTKDNVSLKVSVMGSYICGLLVRFPYAIVSPIFGELLNLQKNRLKILGCDPVGGKEILEPIFDLDNCDLSLKKVKKKLTKRLLDEDMITSFSVDKFGWHVIRKCFDTIPIGYKAKIVNQLKENKTKLVASRYGSYLVNHTKMLLFENNQTEWKQYFINRDNKNGGIKRAMDVDAKVSGFLNEIGKGNSKKPRVK